MSWVREHDISYIDFDVSLGNFRGQSQSEATSFLRTWYCMIRFVRLISYTKIHTLYSRSSIHHHAAVHLQHIWSWGNGRQLLPVTMSLTHLAPCLLVSPVVSQCVTLIFRLAVAYCTFRYLESKGLCGVSPDAVRAVAHC